MSYVIKMVGTKSVYITDYNAMRTVDMKDALKFTNRDEADKSLCGFSSNGQILKEKWEIIETGKVYKGEIEESENNIQNEKDFYDPRFTKEDHKGK